MPITTVEDLTKTYAMGDVEVRALRGVSLSIEEGEFVAVTGPSGSGKSTFMHILGCLDRATRGRYLIDRRDVSRLSREELAEVRNRKIIRFHDGTIASDCVNATRRVASEELAALPPTETATASRASAA